MTRARAAGVVTVAVLAAVAAVGWAQLPDAPQPAAARVRPDPVELAGLGVVAGARVGDWITTRGMLARGNHEVLLPGGVARSGPGLAAVEAGAVAGDWLAGRWLERRGRWGRRAARVVVWADAAGVLACDIHNAELGTVTTTRKSFPPFPGKAR